jgi:hypothetical protein
MEVAASPRVGAGSFGFGFPNNRCIYKNENKDKKMIVCFYSR